MVHSHMFDILSENILENLEMAFFRVIWKPRLPDGDFL